ncbi:ABC transporter ATP-binding protein/permease [bacterium]|nr:ABC transporter ATP-binding protein/permease [bacterium]
MSPSERKASWYLMFMMIVGMVLETVGVSLIIPLMLILTEDDIAIKYPLVKPILDMLNNPTKESLVIFAMLGFLLIYFIKTFYLGFLGWVQSSFSFKMQERLSKELYEKYLRQPYTFHLNRNSAQMVSTVFREVNHFTGSAVAPLLLVISEVLVIMGLGVLLLYVDIYATILIFMSMCILGVTFHIITGKRIENWGKDRVYHDGLRVQQLQQGFDSIKEILVLGRENNFIEDYKIHNTRSCIVGRAQAFFQKLPRLWLEMMAMGALSTLVISKILLGGSISEVVTILGVFAACAFRLLPSATRIASSFQMIKFGVSVVDTLNTEFNLQINKKQHETRKINYPFKNLISFENVSYRYPGSNKYSIQKISIEVKQGETIGIIGKSGSGKSTLINLLLGLLSPSNGIIKVDNKDISDRLGAWQSNIGYVPQNICLTDDTILRNIAFGVPLNKIDLNKAWSALKEAQLDKFVNTLPDILSTKVGERGVRLSGGQCQRIGIARALYHNPPILILDEATSSLDNDTEKNLMQSIWELKGKKTIFIIAHRTSTVANCDRLYKLKNGLIESTGSYDNLVENSR